MSSRLSSKTIKAEAKNLGFFACGIAKAGRVEESYARRFRQWIEQDNHADMTYMANNADKRLDPRLLMDGLKSIISVALNYTPAKKIPHGELQFASYALGQDYHDIVKLKLHTLAAILGLKNYRAFCDSAPVLERYWAIQAGLGWGGHNHQLIIPYAGSMFFLGELFTDIELDYDTPIRPRCGNCRACIDACPTGAISMKEQDFKEHSSFNAALCLSYQTIENRNDIPDSIAAKMGDTVYGCDRCQIACPWNRFASPTDEKLLMPKEELLQMTREKWNCLTIDEYRRLFKGSAVKRAKYEGLMRNIKKVNEKKEITERQQIKRNSNT